MHEISIVLHIAMTLMLVLLEAYVVYMCSLAHVGICTRKDAESSAWLLWSCFPPPTMLISGCQCAACNCTCGRFLSLQAVQIRKNNHLRRRKPSQEKETSFIYLFIYAGNAC